MELLQEFQVKDGDKDWRLKEDLRHALPSSSWLSILANASTKLLESDEFELQIYEKLVGLGRRRAGFLSADTEDIPSLFLA